MVPPYACPIRRLAHDSAPGSFSRRSGRCHRSSSGLLSLATGVWPSWSRAICRPMARAMIRIRGSMAAAAGVGARGRTLVWNHDCRLVVLCATLATAKSSATTFSCLLGVRGSSNQKRRRRKTANISRNAGQRFLDVSALSDPTWAPHETGLEAATTWTTACVPDQRPHLLNAVLAFVRFKLNSWRTLDRFPSPCLHEEFVDHDRIWIVEVRPEGLFMRSKFFVG